MDIQKKFFKSFLLCFFMGVVFILFSTISGISIVFSLILSIVPMLIHFFIVHSIVIKTKELDIEKFSDSLYYLGFIFTLLSLLISILSSSFIGTDLKIQSDKLLTQFGIALVTTITGIILRILLNYMFDNQPKSVKTTNKLERAYDAMAIEVENSTETIKEIRQNSLTSIKELEELCVGSFEKISSSGELAIVGLSNSINKLNEKLSSELAGLSNEILEINKENTKNIIYELKSTIDGILKNSSDSLVQTTKGSIQDIKTLVKQTSSVINTFNNRINKARSPEIIFEEKYGNFLDEYIQQFRDFFKNIKSLSDNITEHNSKLEISLKGMNDTVGLINELPVGIKEIQHAINDFVDSINSFKSLKDVMRDLPSDFSSLDVALKASTHTFENLDLFSEELTLKTIEYSNAFKTLQNSMDVILDLVNKLSISMHTFNSGVEGLKDNSSNASSSVSKYSDIVNSSSSAINNATSMMLNSLVDNIMEINKKIELIK